MLSEGNQITMDDLTPAQKARLQEVADGMLAIYNTYARMRYIHPSWIQQGPHNLSSDILELCRSLKVDPAIVYLYSILPYVDSGGAAGVDFVKRGEVVDFRDASDVEQARNPMFADKKSEMMRPWMTALSGIGNHDCALIYDAKRHHIGIYGQMDCGSSDPNLYDGTPTVMIVDGEEVVVQGQGEDDPMSGDDEDEWADEEEDDGDDASGDEDEDDEEEDDEDDVNHWDEMDSRSAPRVLRDIVLWYENLTEVPGCGERSGNGWSDVDLLMSLYRKNGWPANFDGDAFLVDQVRADAAESAKSSADELAREVEHAKYRVEHAVPPLTEERQKRLGNAKTVDEEWAIRWEVLEAELENDRNQQDLARREAALAALPASRAGDILLAELKHLQSTASYHEREVEKYQAQYDQRDFDAENGQTECNVRLRLEHAQRQLATYRRACAACEADVERDFPGELARFEAAPKEDGHEWRRSQLQDLAFKVGKCEQDIKAVELWVLELPRAAEKTRQTAEAKVEKLREAIENLSKGRDYHLQIMENWKQVS